MLHNKDYFCNAYHTVIHTDLLYHDRMQLCVPALSKAIV